MDWALELSEEEDEIFWKEIKEIEEVRNMPYITSFERVAMKKGMQQGIQQGALRKIERWCWKL